MKGVVLDVCVAARPLFLFHRIKEIMYHPQRAYATPLPQPMPKRMWQLPIILLSSVYWGLSLPFSLITY